MRYSHHALSSSFDSHKITTISPRLNPPYELVFATRFPFAFFFGTSVIARSTTPLISQLIPRPHIITKCQHTRRQTLLQLFRLLPIFHNQRVEVSMTSHFEFNGLGSTRAFDAGSYNTLISTQSVSLKAGRTAQAASFRRHISMNCLMSDTSRGIVAIVVAAESVYVLC